MENSFDSVDLKVAETEFFLKKMIESGSNWYEFQFYFSAYLSSARTVTLALQRFKDKIPGLEEWYLKHQQKLKRNPLSKYLLELRNDHIHGGPSPIVGSTLRGEMVSFRAIEVGDFSSNDITKSSREHLISLLGIVYDCYVRFGVYIDPQQYYTKEHFETLNKTIDDAEVEIWGWIMVSYKEEGFSEDERWHELRGHVGECSINHLFNGYLGKVTPQPVIPDYLEDFNSSFEDRGWIYIPPQIKSIDDYINSLDKINPK